MTAQDFDAARDALDRIDNSGVLGQGERQKKLLRYLVEEELAGRGEAIKAFSVAIDVLGRSDTFDAAKDNIVRVEVGRLRQSLSHYYATTGTLDHVEISVPKGTYRPVFIPRNVLVDADRGTSVGERLGASLTVLPFYALSPDIKLATVAAGLSNTLFVELSRTKLLKIVHSGLPRFGQVSHDVDEICERLGVKYALQGAIQPLSDVLSVSIDLYSAETGRVVWARSYETALELSSKSQADLIRKITLDMRPLFYNQENLALESQSEDDLSADELFVLSTWVLGSASSSLAWERKRLELARRALALKPQFGKAHSVMADKLVYLAAVDPEADTPDTMAAAQDHAHRAATLAPDDADVYMNIAMHHWHLGNLRRAAVACDRALDLDPSNGVAQVMRIGIPYTCKTVPDAVFDEIDAFDASLSHDNPVRWSCKTLKARLLVNNGRLEDSKNLELGANQYYSIPDTAMRLGTILYHCGDVEEAFALVNAQMGNWPTFSPEHLTEVALGRRRRQCPDAVDPVMKLYREFTASYLKSQAGRVLQFGA